MKQNLKISGQLFSLPEDFKNTEAAWSFELRPGGWIIASRPRSEKSGGGVERKRIFIHESKKHLSAHWNGQVLFGEIQNVEVERGGVSEVPNSDTIAQFPGKVRKVMVKEGASIQSGEVLILMEAMKMEFSIRSPYDGKVKKILVQEGQQVSAGDVFLELEKGD